LKNLDFMAETQEKFNRWPVAPIFRGAKNRAVEQGISGAVEKAKTWQQAARHNRRLAPLRFTFYSLLSSGC
jgi:hypothetical protein